MTLSMNKKETSPLVTICEDYSKLKISTIVKGRYPKHDNEIAVTNKVLKQIDAKLGDVIKVKDNEKKVEFLVVGVKQQISYLGKCAAITEDGMRRLEGDFKTNELFVYLKDQKDTKEIIKQLSLKYKDSKLEIANIGKIINTTLQPINHAITLLCLFGIFITLLIIALILYLFVKIKLLKERKRIGTAKAMGYTTKQLILQVVISFCPTCIIGSMIGAIGAKFLINPAFALMLSGSGIVNCNLNIETFLIITSFLGISLFAVLITSFVAIRIRKITPIELFQ